MSDITEDGLKVTLALMKSAHLMGIYCMHIGQKLGCIGDVSAILSSTWGFWSHGTWCDHSVVLAGFAPALYGLVRWSKLVGFISESILMTLSSALLYVKQQHKRECLFVCALFFLLPINPGFLWTYGIKGQEVQNRHDAASRKIPNFFIFESKFLSLRVHWQACSHAYIESSQGNLIGCIFMSPNLQRFLQAANNFRVLLFSLRTS